MKRAGCYIRVSTNDQAEFSPPSQLREMRDYAKKNNMQILDNHIYIDEGISGRNSDRPAFQKMISAAKSAQKPFDILLLYKFSRFARNREDSVVYKSILRNKCGIEVISIKEPIDTENKMSIIMEAFIEAMDEYYSLNLSEDVRRTMTEKALKGQYQSSPPFGYVMTKAGLVPHGEESAVVKEIYSRYANGESCLSIANWLNLSGVRTKRGSRFEKRAVEYILNNPVYCGKIKWKTSGDIGSCGQNNGEGIEVEGEHIPIIDKEMWNKVKSISEKNVIHNRRISTGDARTSDWLSGMIKCSACGGNIVKSGDYWRCGRYVRGRCAVSQHISDKMLKQSIISSMKRDLSFIGDIKFCQQSYDEYKNIKALLNKNTTKLERARQAYLNGVDCLDDYKLTVKSLKQEKSKLLKELKKENFHSKPVIKILPDILLSEEISCELKAQIIHSVIDNMVLNKTEKTLKIYYT